MRYALAIDYHGAGYCGWQRQKHSASVQEAVEAALAKIADHPVSVVCAGRTDTGVHAHAQIVHFDTDVTRPDRAWTFGTNTHLANDISVHWVAQVPDSFHARFSALTRSYRYTILNRPGRSGLLSDRTGWVCHSLDVERMQQAAIGLVGRHDFTSFRSASCQAPHAVREILTLTVARQPGHLITVDVVGNAFLHNMVRILVGSLIAVGLGERSVSWMDELLEARDRTLAGTTAPPAGLCFLQPTYPEEYGIPLFQDDG